MTLLVPPSHPKKSPSQTEGIPQGPVRRTNFRGQEAILLWSLGIFISALAWPERPPTTLGVGVADQRPKSTSHRRLRH